MQNSWSSTASTTGAASAGERISHSALGRSLNQLAWGDFQERWEAAKRLSSFGAIAISPLLGLLDEADEEDWELAWFVTRILAEVPHPEAIASLCDLAQTAIHDEVVSAAVMGLAQQGEAAIAPLKALLTHPSTRRFAAQSLAQIQHPAATALLFQLARDQDDTVRTVAIAALSYSNDPQVFPRLLEALQDPVPAIRGAAVAGLGYWSAAPNGRSRSEHVIPLLWDVTVSVRQQAIFTLGRIGDAGAIAALREALHSPNMPDSLRPDLIRTLGWVNLPIALEALLQELHRLHWGEASHPTAFSLCQEIITVLGRVEAPELKSRATEILLEALAQPVIQTNPLLKQAIAFSLGQLAQPTALDALQRLQADEDERVRFHAIAALKHL